MKERPILFQGAMVRALLAGTKTQTRRAVKPQVLSGQQQISDVIATPDSLAAFVRQRCPYGQPGERLWARESFMHSPAEYEPTISMTHASRPAETAYRADFPDSQPGEGWKPSIHMPRRLCRVELELTEVRVEQLQSISEADAIAEGVERLRDGFRNYSTAAGIIEDAERQSARASYRSLWDRINGEGSWDVNPWVWVVAFRRVKP